MKNAATVFMGEACATNTIVDTILHGRTTRGDRHPSAKLTEADVRKIISLNGQMLKREIAEIFGVSSSTIGDIHSRKKWTWLAMDGPTVMRDKDATQTLNALIAQCRARKLADRYEDRYPHTAASEADRVYQAMKEDE